MLTEAEFTRLLDALMTRIEDAVEDQGLDVDCEQSAGILTLTCPQGAIVLSRQGATRQLWMAAKSGGYHFDYDGSGWHCTRTGQLFETLLAEATAQQAGEALDLSA